MKLSVVLATFNEEKNIRDCLDSVKEIAGEIVVVDGRSKDKTAEIARSLGTRVVSVENNPQFHANKQIAIDQAKGDWILQLDADERVSRELAEEIRDLLKNEPECAGYFLPRKNWFLGRFLAKGGAYPDPVLRLFKRGKGTFKHDEIINNGITTSNVHAQIHVEGKTGKLRHDLIHYGDLSLDKYLLRFNRYTQLEAENMQKLGVHASVMTGIEFMLIKPLYWFLKRYLRHRGYVDGYQGFLFALLSAMHYPVMFLKLVELNRTHEADHDK